MREQLIAAIQGRRTVTFTYEGFPRTVQPAAVGAIAGTRQDTLHAYQVGGGSKRGGVPHWRNFALAKIADLAVLDQVFGPNPPGYGHPSFSTVYAALDGGGAPPPPAPGKDQLIPGVPITGEQAAKAAEQAGKVIGEAAEKLGKWFRKR
jgi:hypothetical protein